jgi:hypothetical protein
MGCKPAESIAHIDGECIREESKEAQEIKRQEIEEVG